ncbi:MAG: 4Fe-4S binding protein [Deltaproteobacteria bacterium]|nr:4Fe-4S binding protein [Deltaproteobacteria bacterium]MCF8119525.1 4Fe-4S binding protein [Deltaproteobacteria bacterium]
MRPYALIIDHESCWGCKTCEVACKQENHAPSGMKLIWVQEDGPRMIDHRPDFHFRVEVCRHCEEPECMMVCPEEAIHKREDGIVVLNSEICSGCGVCAEACPYEAISMDPQTGLAGKCNLCHHRVDQGLIPACADNVCLAHCIYFGDPEKNKAEIREKHRIQP